MNWGGGSNEGTAKSTAQLQNQGARKRPAGRQPSEFDDRTISAEPNSLRRPISRRRQHPVLDILAILATRVIAMCLCLLVRMILEEFGLLGAPPEQGLAKRRLEPVLDL